MIVQVEHPEPGVRNAVCTSGHRTYYFRLDNGCWESQSARRIRMASYRICDECGEEFIEAADKNRTERTLCSACKKNHLLVSWRISYAKRISEAADDHRGVKGELESVL
jgi:hypothetical protein